MVTVRGHPATDRRPAAEGGADMTPCVIAANRVELAGAGLSARAELSTPRSQRGHGRTSGAPTGPVESADPAWVVALSDSERLCYRFRRLGGVIWEISGQLGNLASTGKFRLKAVRGG